MYRPPTPRTPARPTRPRGHECAGFDCAVNPLTHVRGGSTELLRVASSSSYCTTLLCVRRCRPSKELAESLKLVTASAARVYFKYATSLNELYSVVSSVVASCDNAPTVCLENVDELCGFDVSAVLKILCVLKYAKVEVFFSTTLTGQHHLKLGHLGTRLGRALSLIVHVDCGGHIQ